MTSSGRSVSLVFALYLTVFGVMLVTMVVTGYDMRRRCLVIIPLLFVTLLLLPACSNGNGSHRSRGTPSGAYTITVKGASGATHATSVQVSVY